MTVLTLLLALPLDAGEVRGQILISRGLTKKKLSLPNYQMRGPVVSSQAPPATEYQRIAIYLEAQRLAAPASAALVQEGQRFSPEVLVVPVGSQVAFPNEDPIFHNVFSLSPAKPFDLGYYPQGDSRSERFDRPGIVQVFCHLHPDMSAAIVVVASNWYTQPNQTGDFRLQDIPAGDYQLVVWHKSGGFYRRQIEVPEQGAVELSIDIPMHEGP